MKPKFLAVVKNQRLLFPPRGLEMYRKHLSALEGKEIEITIDKRKKSRSNQQNRYYFGVCIQIIADELGYEPIDIHYELRRLFLSSPGEKLQIPRSTTSLSTVEHNEFIEKVKRWSSEELNIYIPDPEEVSLDE